MTPHPSRALRRARPARWLLAGAGLVLLALAVVESRSGAVGLVAAGGAAAAVAATAVLRAHVPLRAVEERGLWRWCARAVLVLAVALALEAAADVVGAQTGRSWAPGAALTLGALGACVCAYQGLLSWNRFRTAAAHPADWVNAVGSVLCGLAAGGYLLDLADGTTSGPGWAIEGHVVRLAALAALAATALAVTLVGGLRRDPRAWLLVVGLLGMCGVELVAAELLAARGPAAAAAPGPWLVLAWAALPLVTAFAGTVARTARHTHFASSQVITVTALASIVTGVGVLLAHGIRPAEQVLVPVLAALGVLGGCVRMVRTTSELSRLARTRREARTDPLTGVPNRRAMTDTVDGFAAAASGAAVVVIDLDKFKDVNDRYGHAAGDHVIVTVCDRLQARLDGAGMLARFGGDEFAVVLDDGDIERAVALATGLRDAVREPLEIVGRTVHLDASIGVASTTFGDHRDGELLRRADSAMYTAKRAGGGVRVYDEEADARARDERALTEELRAMLTGGGAGLGELVLHYQPQLSCADGAVVGMEALVRWAHPTRGLLYPDAFLEVAERSGSMFALTERVLGAATRQAARWRRDHAGVAVAVNLSTSCLEHPRLLAVLDRALAEAGLAPDGLVVEITETTLMHDPPRAVAVTHAIADRGIGVSIDDYGAGYSSLTYLNELPASELKLDRSFTAQLTADRRTRAIVSGTLEIAHELGLRLIAEGVEDDDTSALLRGMGCDRSQGYLHSRPMPPDEADSWLGAHPPVPTPRRRAPDRAVGAGGLPQQRGRAVRA